MAAALTAIRERWGRRDFLEQLCREIVPNLADDEEFRRWFVRHYRLCASPSAAHAFYRMWMETDIRDVLPAIRVPTVALYRQNRRDPARHLAEQIRGATAVELPGMSDALWTEPGVDKEVERFVGGVREEAEPERVLVTILFTDIVGSTAKAAELGDQRWRKLLNQHHALVRSELLRFRGHERSTSPATAFSRASTAPHAQAAARARLRTPPRRSGSRSAPAFTRANVSSSTGRSAGSRFTSERGSRPRPGRGRSSSRARSRTWSRDPEFASLTEVSRT